MRIPFLGSRKDKPSPDNMTLGEHLGELRYRLVVCVVAFVVAAMVCVFLYEPILHFLIHPLCNVDNAAAKHGRKTVSSLLTTNGSTCNLFVTSPLDGLSLRVKISVFGGLVMASPVILFQLWRFITPGLQAREKKYAVPFVTAAFVLFLLGAATAYCHAAARAGLPALGGWSEPAGDLRPDSVSGADPAHDGAVRPDLSVPGHPGLARTGPGGDPGPPAASHGAGP